MSLTQVNTDSTSAIEQLTTDLVASWLEYERLDGASQNTIIAYRKGIDVWVSWIESQADIKERPILAGDVLQFKSALLKQGYSAQTVNLRLSAVRSFYRYLVVNNGLPYNPASEVKGAKRSKSTVHKRDALTTEEVRCLLDIDTSTSEGIRDYAMLSLMAYCGVREVEIHRANLEDLRTVADRLVLYVQGKGHTEKDEYVVIPQSQEQFIRSWYAQRRRIDRLGLKGQAGPLFCSLSNRSYGHRLSTRGIRSIVKRRFDTCGIVGDKKTTHSLRHTAITNAIRNGATHMQVQAMARHSSFDTTLNYIHEVNRIDSPAEDLITY